MIAYTNGYMVDQTTLAHIIKIAARQRLIDVDRAQFRTRRLLAEMRNQGFDPNTGAWAIIPLEHRDAFEDHAAFRYLQGAKAVYFLSPRLIPELKEARNAAIAAAATA